MRIKIIAGNLFAVLLVGVISWSFVNTTLTHDLGQQLDSQLENRYGLLTQSWQLSGLEFVQDLEGLVDPNTSAGGQNAVVFTSTDDNAQRDVANRRANAIADWFGSSARSYGGPPDIVLFTDHRGSVIARNLDPNQMVGDDFRRTFPELRRVLEHGDGVLGAWVFTAGSTKLLRVAAAPMRNPDGHIVGALVVGFEVSNGMAEQVGHLLQGEVAVVGATTPLACSDEGLRSEIQAFFDENEELTSSAYTSAGRRRFSATLRGHQFVGMLASLPNSGDADAALVLLADRTDAMSDASVANMILLMTLLGVLVVLGYGFAVGNLVMKPIAEIDKGLLAVINGQSDLRLDVDSAELGGLAYRINQLLNVMTGTPEQDDEGRVSSPPGAWVDPSAGFASDRPDESEGGEAELAAKLEAEPEDEYYARVYREYVSAKKDAGEDMSNVTEERFVQRLKANEKKLLEKHGCRMVRFQVQIRGTQVNLQPVIIR